MALCASDRSGTEAECNPPNPTNPPRLRRPDPSTPHRPIARSGRLGTHDPGPVATLFQGPKPSVVASSGPRSFCRFCWCSILSFLFGVPVHNTQNTTQRTQHGRISAVQPQHPSLLAAPTHTTPERGRATWRPHWQQPAAKPQLTSDGSLRRAFRVQRDLAAARIFETTLLPGPPWVSKRGTTREQPCPGLSRLNEHPRLRHAIVRPCFSRDSPHHHTEHRRSDHVSNCLQTQPTNNLSSYGGGRFQGRCGNRLVACME